MYIYIYIYTHICICIYIYIYIAAAAVACRGDKSLDPLGRDVLRKIARTSEALLPG